MHIFCHTYQKNVLQKEIKDWTFEVYLLTGKLSSWFQLIELLKMTCTRSYALFVNFLSSIEGLDCFLWPNVLPKLIKIIVTYLKSVKIKRLSSTSTCPNSHNFELFKVAKWLVWKSRYLQSWRNQKHHFSTANKPHSQGSIGYSTSGGSVIITS